MSTSETASGSKPEAVVDTTTETTDEEVRINLSAWALSGADHGVPGQYVSLSFNRDVNNVVLDREQVRALREELLNVLGFDHESIAAATPESADRAR